MKMTVELRRVGMSRVAVTNIPIQARCVQGTPQKVAYGGDLLLSVKPTDVVVAKDTTQALLDHRFGVTVAITWLDRTGE